MRRHYTYFHVTQRKSRDHPSPEKGAEAVPKARER